MLGSRIALFQVKSSFHDVVFTVVKKGFAGSPASLYSRTHTYGASAKSQAHHRLCPPALVRPYHLEPYSAAYTSVALADGSGCRSVRSQPRTSRLCNFRCSRTVFRAVQRRAQLGCGAHRRDSIHLFRCKQGKPSRDLLFFLWVNVIRHSKIHNRGAPAPRRLLNGSLLLPPHLRKAVAVQSGAIGQTVQAEPPENGSFSCHAFLSCDQRAQSCA